MGGPPARARACRLPANIPNRAAAFAMWLTLTLTVTEISFAKLKNSEPVTVTAAEKKRRINCK